MLSLKRRQILQFLSGVFTLPFGPALAQEVGQASSPDVWVPNYPEQHVWGYADRLSVLPGERFDVMLACGPNIKKVAGRLEIVRVGATDERAPIVWSSAPLALGQQPVTPTSATLGAAWPPSLLDVPTSGWPPGVYSAHFAFDNGFRDTDLFQLVVRNPSAAGDVLLKLGTNTYQAYNEWGGHSLYPRGDRPPGAMVSFDRPDRPAFFEYDVYLMRFLEQAAAKHGFRIDYTTDFDFHADPAIADRYRVLASSAHDEYWSKEMFDAVEHRIKVTGKNTIFYGANAAYRQIRYADVNRGAQDRDRGRQMICFKDMTDPIARRSDDPALWVATEFRRNARRPETMLMGIAYQSWFPPDSRRFAYRVIAPEGPLFAGTSWRAGEAVGDVVGYEWDNRDPDGDGRRLFDPKRSHISELPLERIKVLFEGSPVDVNGKPGRAEAVYFETPAGAKVFSSGSTRWAWGMGKPGFEQSGLKTFNENLILHMLRG